MKPEAILETINSGESQSVEFKADFSPELGKSLCAFANTNAGTVFVGVSDDGRIKGVLDDVEEKVAQVAHSCKPAIYPEISKVICEGKLVLIVAVPHSRGILHSYKNIAYKRVGTNDMPLSPEEVIAFARQTRMIRFDNQFCEANLADIDEAAIRKFVRSAIAQRRLDIAPDLPIAEILEKLELKQGNNLTYAAILLFGKEPQKLSLQSEVRCARFKGTDSLRFIDMKVLRGNVIDLIDNAEKFVMNHIRLEAEVVDFLREEKWEYPLSAVREAITNAICHRDYFSTANVHISIFDDRLEVWNPGTLPPELTIDDLKKPHKSIPRNPLIANALFLIKYIERWGTGTERIVRDTIAHGLPEPEFKQSSGGFEIVFRKAEAFLESLNERQKKAWEYLRDKETITSSIYAELCKCAVRTALSDLRQMQKRGLLKREGKRKATVFRRTK
ncbi:MAG: helix-turn-helix domain-containing protein [candidate division KSB1 bacterium]|nr:helix-turn-helix domain-containing protein [candidate division KSB1 bacterium]MDZ7303860.1 helix-turn-helix domain-containing protein [candidate division KSB1 bacterium]MDZ7313216.1 helix-turn-helix domain-containing protein [candidate division KSB1 bacterium]